MPDEPKKETVRISLPGEAAEEETSSKTPPAPSPPARPKLFTPLVPAPAESAVPRPPAAKPPIPPPPPAGIVAPSGGKIAAPPAARVLPPSGPARSPVPPAAPVAAPADSKKKTARINIQPDPPKPAVEIGKTQRLITVTATPAGPLPPKVAVAPQPPSASALTLLDSVPAPICWTLLGASALLLLIEIWNYIS